VTDNTTVNRNTLPPLQDGHCITVTSNDPRESACKGCGERRVIFQAYYFAFEPREMRARCKACHEIAAKERGGTIFVKANFRTTPAIWKNDRLNTATPSQRERSAKGVEARRNKRF
jgi:ribosomal protein S27E